MRPPVGPPSPPPLPPPPPMLLSAPLLSLPPSPPPPTTPAGRLRVRGAGSDGRRLQRSRRAAPPKSALAREGDVCHCVSPPLPPPR